MLNVAAALRCAFRCGAELLTFSTLTWPAPIWIRNNISGHDVKKSGGWKAVSQQLDPEKILAWHECRQRLLHCATFLAGVATNCN
ncbi:hypothetical protein V8J88_13060 [Massilia sp. W12]|uniref:hypothetical protein n=1 Tax=Massilia sp. W12 TaxID=3126507 RepID=UPI0030CEF74A